ncbi:MAG: ABC transporter permease [Chloroflexi bacterium]|nr:ABC transporter permease [Chloroflexota bacterium]MCL5074062.1 ABC transporter permease [Chloroflexota bacterium]
MAESSLATGRMDARTTRLEQSRPQQFGRALWVILGGDRVSACAGLVVFTLVLTAIFAPVISPYDPLQIDLPNRLQAPNWDHWLGTDDFGRDMLSRIIFGTRLSLLSGGLSVLIALAVGLVLGIVSGYFGGISDSLIMRSMDVLLSFPAILLAIVVMALLGPGLSNVIIAVGVSQVAIFARLARSMTLSIRANEYIEAAISVGAGTRRILARYILPNIVTLMMVQATATLGSAIVMAASLNFLGMGVQPPTPDWGAMVNEGQKFMFQHQHIPLFPGLAIALAVLSLNLWGDGLQKMLDPALRGRL